MIFMSRISPFLPIIIIVGLVMFLDIYYSLNFFNTILHCSDRADTPGSNTPNNNSTVFMRAIKNIGIDGEGMLGMMAKAIELGVVGLSVKVLGKASIAFTNNRFKYGGFRDGIFAGGTSRLYVPVTVLYLYHTVRNPSKDGVLSRAINSTDMNVLNGIFWNGRSVRSILFPNGVPEDTTVRNAILQSMSERFTITRRYRFLSIFDRARSVPTDPSTTVPVPEETPLTTGTPQLQNQVEPPVMDIPTATPSHSLPDIGSDLVQRNSRSDDWIIGSPVENETGFFSRIIDRFTLKRFRDELNNRLPSVLLDNGKYDLLFAQYNVVVYVLQILTISMIGLLILFVLALIMPRINEYLMKKEITNRFILGYVNRILKTRKFVMILFIFTLSMYLLSALYCLTFLSINFIPADLGRIIDQVLQNKNNE